MKECSQWELKIRINSTWEKQNCSVRMANWYRELDSKSKMKASFVKKLNKTVQSNVQRFNSIVMKRLMVCSHIAADISWAGQTQARTAFWGDRLLNKGKENSSN